jgi:hypothetical protein
MPGALELSHARATGKGPSATFFVLRERRV